MPPDQLQETITEIADAQAGTDLPPASAPTPAKSKQGFASVGALESQQAELVALREQLSLRDQAFDSVNTHFMITSKAGVIEYCNRAVAERHGVRRNELMGKSVRALMGKVPQTPSYKDMMLGVYAGSTAKFEETFQREDGASFLLGVTVVPMRRNEQDEVTHIFSMAADITARREAEQHAKQLQEQLVAEMKQRESILLELRLAQKLESVGRLAAGVAHEINTPIQYVGDSLYFLRNAFDDLTRLIATFSAILDEQPATVEVTALKQRLQEATQVADLPFLLSEVPNAFTRTFEGVDRVAGIVRAMKEFSHPDATEFNPADINHALQTTLIVATNEYKYIAKVHTEFDPDLPQVTCNVGELNQVFLNLIVNAAHAIHDSGKDVDQGEIRITTTQAGDCVEIKVEDNGCGIPQEHLDKIYDPFFTTKEVGRGTGQGLAITRSIVVDKHGGTVQASSEIGKGTQFIISLPIAGRNKAGPS